ncbi:hypothetical protein [Spirosoma pomorum]
MMSALVLMFAVIGQLMMTFVFAKQALVNHENTLNRVGSTVAAGVFLTMALIITWFVLNHPLS